jgi:hypothetical protein
MRRFIPFLFLLIALVVAIGAFATTHSAALLLEKHDDFDWRAAARHVADTDETPEVTS